MSKAKAIIADNLPLDEAVWQAWLEKNRAQDKVRFARRVKILAVVSAILIWSGILWWLWLPN